MSYSVTNGGRAFSGLGAGVEFSASASFSTSGGAEASAGGSAYSDSQLVEATYGESWCAQHGGVAARVEDNVKCKDGCGCRGQTCGCAGYVPPPPAPPLPGDANKTPAKKPCLTITENAGKEPPGLSALYRLSYPWGKAQPIICSGKMLTNKQLGPIARICNTSANPLFCAYAKANPGATKAFFGRGTPADMQRWRDWPANGIKAGQVPTGRPGGAVNASWWTKLLGKTGTSTGTKPPVYRVTSPTPTQPIKATIPTSPTILTVKPAAPTPTIMSPAPTTGSPAAAPPTTSGGDNKKLLLIGGAVVVAGGIAYFAMKRKK